MTASLLAIVFAQSWPQYQALHIANGDISTPSFYILDKHFGDIPIAGFEQHPARVDTLEEADFVVTGGFKFGSLQKFLDLPRRSKEKPYLIMAHGLEMHECSNADNKPFECAVVSQIFDQREDFTYVNFDLRDHILTDNHAPLLPGVTMAPPVYYSGPPVSPFENSHYFLTFRGSMNDGYYGSAHVRSDLQMFKDFQSPDVVVELLPFHHQHTAEDVQIYNGLLNTSYGLVPHGDGRWNFRFSEVIGACAIPVIIADGLTLPFEELIDWKAAAVVLEEATFMSELNERFQGQYDGAKAYSHMLMHPEHLLEHLSTNLDDIQEMRRRVCEINDMYFSSDEKRITALLKSAAVRAQR